jgi:hypothetical protein
MGARDHNEKEAALPRGLFLSMDTAVPGLVLLLVTTLARTAAAGVAETVRLDVLRSASAIGADIFAGATAAAA